MLLLGAMGWGLFTVGAVTHLLDLERLTFLLSSHTVRFAGIAARLLVAVETSLAVAMPVGFFAFGQTLASVVAAAGALLAIGFTVWVLRLIVTKSALPCACSFSSAPPTPWSLARSAATALIGFFALADPGTWSNDLATLLVGGAIGVVIFVAPDAVVWPQWSQEMRAYARSSAPSQATP